ncbi:unnamed protein product [Phaedon cochleariae]|uniref:Uncharacterized protein n=1 Tax=Phaedon cochleariae TaxID=80249 RepID=A0A9N9SEJ9_PHACE|nr:unnamed protein product [Phaedon cochleariae]
MVFKNKGRTDESSMVSKAPSSKFMSKSRSDNPQYSTNSSAGHDGVARYSEQDVQEEFQRVYTQLEVLRERNMRMGNRHLASKITAMQDAARTHDHSAHAAMSCDPVEDSSPVKTKRPSVSFAVSDRPEDETAAGPRRDPGLLPGRLAGEPKKPGEEPKKPGEEPRKSADEPDASSPKDGKGKESRASATDSNGRYLMSGHARTHSIVINLDDKSRFTDEITV